MLYNAISTTLVYAIVFSILTYFVAFRILWPALCYALSHIVIPASLKAYSFLYKAFTPIIAVVAALVYTVIAYSRQTLGIEKADAYLDMKIRQIKSA